MPNEETDQALELAKRILDDGYRAVRPDELELLARVVVMQQVEISLVRQLRGNES